MRADFRGHGWPKIFSEHSDTLIESEFGIIGAFNVLEHIKENELVLSQIYKALKPGGGIILTVPQHPFLWSKVDERSCHVRRYSAADF